MNYLVSQSSGLSGDIKVPGDKSISHRSIIFASLAEGESRINDILEGEDVLATIQAFRKMGVDIRRTGDGEMENHYQVQGVGMHGLCQPETILDMGNSGTAFRLLSGLMCAQRWTVTLDGDESLRQRPMGRIIQPLSDMGAIIESRDGMPPLKISPASQIEGIDYVTPMASAQVKSAILLAGLYAQGETIVRENAPTRDHTERMLQGFGYDVSVDEGVINLSGGGGLKGVDMQVPADLSSAAFFVLAGLICPDSELCLTGVGTNPSRNGVISILQRMGADLKLANERNVSGEPVADLIVKSSVLHGVDIDSEDVALAIDEIPAIAVAAACAAGTTRITGAEELRVKESDRISSVVNGLKALGVEVEEQPDGMVIEGGELCGGEVNSFGDHRIAMAFAVAGCRAKGPVKVLNCENVATSFPGFDRLAKKCGMNFVIE